jgi:hypothetical protein
MGRRTSGFSGPPARVARPRPLSLDVSQQGVTATTMPDANAPDHLFDTAWRSMNDELSGESDRAAAIVGCALLDERLRELLDEFLIQNSDGRTDLLSAEDVNAPLGSFGSRIVAAYAVGLIDKPQRDALRRLKRVRNLFAHKPGRSFKDQDIATHCAEIQRLCPTTHPGGEDRTSRQLFQDTVAFLAGRLAERRYWINTFGLKGTFESVFKQAISKHREPSQGSG